MSATKALVGKYYFADGRLRPDDGMRSILARLSGLKMLAGSTEKTEGEFFYSPVERTYWRYTQQENYVTALEPITRSEIELRYPHIRCDEMIDVPREDAD